MLRNDHLTLSVVVVQDPVPLGESRALLSSVIVILLLFYANSLWEVFLWLLALFLNMLVWELNQDAENEIKSRNWGIVMSKSVILQHNLLIHYT